MTFLQRIDAANKLLVVLDEHFKHQHALLIHHQLLLQIRDALAQAEDQFCVDILRLIALRIALGRLQRQSFSSINWHVAI